MRYMAMINGAVAQQGDGGRCPANCISSETSLTFYSQICKLSDIVCTPSVIGDSHCLQ